MSCEKCEELKEVLRDILEWEKSSPVQGAFQMAWVHGMICDEEFSKKAGKMFERAKELAEDDNS